MIQDNDEQVLERDDRLIKAMKCVELFVENHTLTDPNQLKSTEYKTKYDKDKVRQFYNSKEAKFRKIIKSVGMTISICNDFHSGDGYDDVKSYHFYFGGKFLFVLNLHFTNKNISRGTYDDLQYRIVDITEVTPKDLYQIVTNYKGKYV